METRKSPFTTLEKELLTEIASKYINIIEARKTDNIYNKQKTEAWIALAAKFNSSRTISQEATHLQLKKLWLNMKTRARDVKSAAKQRMHTGGGPYMPDPPPGDDMLEGVLSSINIMPSVKVAKDSDGIGDLDGDDDDEMWLPKMKRVKQKSIFFKETDNNSQDEFNEDQVIKTKYQDQVLEDSNRQTELQNEIGQVELQNSIEQQPETTKKTNVQKFKIAPNVDTYKKELIQNDIEQRDIKFKANMEHTEKCDSLKYEILKLEYEHKKKCYALIEKEQELKTEEQAIKLKHTMQKYYTSIE